MDNFTIINLSDHYVTLRLERSETGHTDFHDACEALYRHGLKFIDRERAGDYVYFFCERHGGALQPDYFELGESVYVS